MLKIEFSGGTPEEVTAAIKDFVKTQLKNPRGGKAGDDDGVSTTTGQGTGNAPPPLAPPTGGAAFNPGASAFPAGGGAAFPGAGASTVAPEVQAIVQRIVTRVDGAIAGGQNPEQALQWFRGQCGPEAASATLDQIKTNFLPRLAMPTLENIAKLMAA